MNKYANYADGKITIATYRSRDAIATTVDDLIESVESGTDLPLTASIDTDEQLSLVHACSAYEYF